MPRTTRAAQSVLRTGLTPSYTAADSANGEQFLNDGSALILHVKDTGGGACTVTLNIAITTDGQASTHRTVVVPATTGDKLIGPFPTAIYLQTDGYTYIDYSTATGVTAALFKVVT